MTDWMAKLPNHILLSDINIPGTHDSCAYFVKFNHFSRCQRLPVYEQLHLGVRFLDLRVKKQGKKLVLVHSIMTCYEDASHKTPLTLDKVIADCRKFLSANPSETILFSLKRDDGISSAETFNFFFENYIKNDAFWYLENRIPTLGEARGKIVLLNRCQVDFSYEKNSFSDYNIGIDLTHFPDQSRVDFTGFETAFIHHNSTGGKEKFYLQDMYKLSPREKWKNGILPTLENAPDDGSFVLNFFSSSTLFFSPEKTSKIIVKKIKKYPLERGKKYGILIFDFPSEATLRKVVLTNL